MKQYIMPVLVILIAFGAIAYGYGAFDSGDSDNNLVKKNQLDNGLDQLVREGNEQIVMMSLKNGVYHFEPSRVKAGVPVIIKDAGIMGCGLFVKQPQLGLDMDFTKKSEYKFTPEKPGTFKFSCSMSMYHGELEII